MTAQPEQPDIEIYVKDSNFDEIQNWLSSIFAPILLPKFTGKPVNFHIGSEPKIPVMITPNAAGKAFTSIWFQSNNTPWKSDEECAMSFLASNDTAEIRCSANSWKEEEEEYSEQWLCITQNEKRLILWG